MSRVMSHFGLQVMCQQHTRYSLIDLSYNAVGDVLTRNLVGSGGNAEPIKFHVALVFSAFYVIDVNCDSILTSWVKKIKIVVTLAT